MRQMPSKHTSVWRLVQIPHDPTRSPRTHLTSPPNTPQVFVPDVNPSPLPLFCRLQGLGVTTDPTPTPQLPATAGLAQSQEEVLRLRLHHGGENRVAHRPTALVVA